MSIRLERIIKNTQMIDAFQLETGDLKWLIEMARECEEYQAALDRASEKKDVFRKFIEFYDTPKKQQEALKRVVPMNGLKKELEKGEWNILLEKKEKKK